MVILNEPNTGPERLPAEASAQAGSRRTLNILSTILFYLSILTFIIGFNFSDTPLNGGWTQQFMPDLGGRPLSDITFTDSLTGYAITNSSSITDTAHILKTTSGGDNWVIKFKEKAAYRRVIFLNNNTGYIGGSSLAASGALIYKTTNGGNNWTSLNVPGFTNLKDLFVLNEDTIWIVDDNGLTGGIYRSTNGGNSWLLQFSAISANPNKIYMYNRNIGFACDDFRLYKTTNSGDNWLQISDISLSNSFRDIYFVDSITGWKAYNPFSPDSNMQKTTNGGLNWYRQKLPSGGIIQSSVMSRFTNINRDTIWGGGGSVLFPNNQPRGTLYRTTNGGDNWLFQIPDTSLIIPGYPFVDFVNKNNGWGYLSLPPTGIHTTTGGNDTFFTPVKETSSNIPKQFLLHQNYPNPFNPSTVIRFQIRKLADLKLVVYDVIGKEINRLADNEYKPGTYEVTFDGTSYSSGIYFYSLYVDGKLVDTKRMILLK